MSPAERLGDFERATLLALVHLGTNAYGMTVRQELEARLSRNVSIGAVYTTLERMEEKGYVSSWKGDPTPARGGRAKKYFRIEAKGQKALSESFNEAQRLWDGIVPVGA